MKLLSLVAGLWIALIIPVLCLTYEEIKIRTEIHLALIQRGNDVACSQHHWLIVASASSFKLVDFIGTFPKNVYDINASASHLSAMIDCSEGKVKRIHIQCTSDERYIFNYTLLHTIGGYISEEKDSKIQMIMGYLNDEQWYIFAAFASNVVATRYEAGLIIFGKNLLEKTDAEIIKNKVFKDQANFNLTEESFGPFYVRKPGEGKCDATGLRKGAKVASDEESETLMFVLMMSFVGIFLLLLGGFVLRAVMQGKPEPEARAVRFECYTSSN